jgi:hypothetical protein
MSDTEDAVVYRYEPHFDGEFFRGVPARDLTQADVDRLDPAQQRDAFATHPLYGTPLYVPVDEAAPPKWWSDKVAAAEERGEGIAPRYDGETKRQYEDRIAAETAADAAAVEPSDPVSDETDGAA